MLEEIPNIEKRNTDFDKWLKETVETGAITDYKRKHYIPNVDLGLNNFLQFLEERETLIIEQLKQELIC